LDPFYRTIRGFATLIEKEWIQFGHQFYSRSGHNETVTSEWAPIFIQFLDCAWQIMQQHPCSFEYSDALLQFVSENLFTCRFGTFLVNNVKDQQRFAIRESTVSIWSYVQYRMELFRNPLYNPLENESSPPRNKLSICTSGHALQLWPGHLRHMEVHRSHTHYHHRDNYLNDDPMEYMSEITKQNNTNRNRISKLEKENSLK